MYQIPKEPVFIIEDLKENDKNNHLAVLLTGTKGMIRVIMMSHTTIHQYKYPQRASELCGLCWGIFFE